MSLVLIAQTEAEIVDQVVSGLCNGYAVELDSGFQYMPVDWFPSGERSRFREELRTLGGRVAECWDTKRPRGAGGTPGAVYPETHH